MNSDGLAHGERDNSQSFAATAPIGNTVRRTSPNAPTGAFAANGAAGSGFGDASARRVRGVRPLPCGYTAPAAARFRTALAAAAQATALTTQQNARNVQQQRRLDTVSLIGDPGSDWSAARLGDPVGNGKRETGNGNSVTANGEPQ